MNCKDAKDMITVGVFGELKPDEKALLESHLRDCPSCARFFEGSKPSRAMFEVPDQYPRPDWDRSWETIPAGALGRTKTWRLFGLPGRWTAAAASLLVVFAIGFFFGRRAQKPPMGPTGVFLASAAEPSPLSRFAETFEPVLIDFLNEVKVGELVSGEGHIVCGTADTAVREEAIFAQIQKELV